MHLISVDLNYPWVEKKTKIRFGSLLQYQEPYFLFISKLTLLSVKISFTNTCVSNKISLRSKLSLFLLLSGAVMIICNVSSLGNRAFICWWVTLNNIAPVSKYFKCEMYLGAALLSQNLVTNTLVTKAGKVFIAKQQLTSLKWCVLDRVYNEITVWHAAKTSKSQCSRQKR